MVSVWVITRRGSGSQRSRVQLRCLVIFGWFRGGPNATPEDLVTFSRGSEDSLFSSHSLKMKKSINVK